MDKWNQWFGIIFLDPGILSRYYFEVSMSIEFWIFFSSLFILFIYICIILTCLFSVDNKYNNFLHLNFKSLNCFRLKWSSSNETNSFYKYTNTHTHNQAYKHKNTHTLEKRRIQPWTSRIQTHFDSGLKNGNGYLFKHHVQVKMVHSIIGMKENCQKTKN